MSVNSQSGKVSVAIQGDYGSNHHLVLEKFPKLDYELVSCMSFTEVFEKVQTSEVDLGLIAIENSLAGSIAGNYDLLSNSKLRVGGEVYLRIVHNLIGLIDSGIEDIEAVYSHEMALKQCRTYLDDHNLEPREYADTAAAVDYIVKQNKKRYAAIAPELAAEHFGGKVLARGIETDKENYTRFVWLTRDGNIPQGVYFGDNSTIKTMLEIITLHQPGSLAKVLKHLADAELNLTKLESRPIVGERWNYKFYLDFETTKSTSEVEKILVGLKGKVRFMRILGQFESGVHFD